MNPFFSGKICKNVKVKNALFSPQQENNCNYQWTGFVIDFNWVSLKRDRNPIWHSMPADNHLKFGAHQTETRVSFAIVQSNILVWMDEEYRLGCVTLSVCLSVRQLFCYIAVLNYSYRWNEHFADSILGQHLSLRRKFSALNHSTISSTPKKDVQMPEDIHLLYNYSTGWKQESSW